MHESLLICLALIFSASILVLIASRLSVPYPIFLVMAGLAMSFVPGVPKIQIDPDIVFLIILPPVLFDAAQNTSWKALWKWRRIVSFMALGYVMLTATVVAFAACWLIPGFSLPHGFLLGAIISPPDAAAATTILKKIRLPKSLVAILEGESLLNDASSLTVYRFALTAIISHHFEWPQAVGNFLLISSSGIAIGFVFGLLFYAIYKWLPTTANLNIALSFVLPYIIYLTAEAFQSSGVLAVVTGGLFIVYQNHHIFSHSSRLRSNAVWLAIIFVLNAVIFFLIGLQLPCVTAGIPNITSATVIALLITIIVIVTRLAAGYISSLFTAFISRYLSVSANHAGWRNPLIISWAGMRGVVSLASALAIPLFLTDGVPFPFRPLILYITFIVIIVTLVGQGLALPWIISSLKPESLPCTKEDEQQILEIESLLITTAVEKLNSSYLDAIQENPILRNKLDLLTLKAGIYQQFGDDAEKKAQAFAMNGQFKKIMMQIAKHQRNQLSIIRLKEEFDDDVIRFIENRLDLDEEILDENAE
ncbi:Na+/H+ antiporter [Mucilaginibacter phyllosphaerae]